MNRLFALLFAVSVVTASYAGVVTVKCAIAVDKDTKPATSFTSDTPKLYAFFLSKGTEKGDLLRGVWIAEDVGEAAPESTIIDEATLTADKDDFGGAFSASKPDKGWPIGKYKVEIYDGEELVWTANFTITAAK